MFAQPCNDKPNRDFEDAWFSVMECGVAEEIYPKSEFFHCHPMKVRMAETFANLMRYITGIKREVGEIDAAYGIMHRAYEEEYEKRKELERINKKLIFELREAIKIVTDVTDYGEFSTILREWRSLTGYEEDEITECQIHGNIVVNGQCPRC